MKCTNIDCVLDAIYGLNDDTPHKLWCKEHKLKDSILKKSGGYCVFEDCDKRASYNYVNKKKEIFCLSCIKKHNILNVVNVKHQYCIVKECNVRATHRLKEDEKILYCKKCFDLLNKNIHLEIDLTSKNHDINIINEKIIKEKNQKWRDNYKLVILELKEKSNFIEEKQDLLLINTETKIDFKYFCSNMVDGVKCVNEGLFIHQSNIHQKYCYFCKKNDMYQYNLLKFCIGKNEEGCPLKKRPSFNLPGLVPRYCKECSSEEMIDLKHDLCINTFEDGKKCTKRALFNFPNEKKPIYCGRCAKAKHGDEMIDIVVKRCIGILENGDKCMTQPSHNYPHIRTPKYCAKCASKESPEMIDVMTKRCCGILMDGKKCTTFATYNYPNKTDGLYCFNCSLDGMVAVRIKKCIECIDIKKYNPTHKIGRAEFNISTEKSGLYCRLCKTPDMINVTYNRCKQELCDTLATLKIYEGYCSRCYFFNNPDKPLTRCYRSKEIEVSNFIKSNFEGFEISLNKTVGSGCSRKRPDIFFELGDYCLIVEVDENQHIEYDCCCESKRLVSIFDDVGERNIIFIRFNPDGYYDKNGIHIKSPWTKNTMGLTYVPKAKKPLWEDRLQILKNTIEYWLENPPEKMIEIVQLFYDQNIDD